MMLDNNIKFGEKPRMEAAGRLLMDRIAQAIRLDDGDDDDERIRKKQRDMA